MSLRTVLNTARHTHSRACGRRTECSISGLMRPAYQPQRQETEPDSHPDPRIWPLTEHDETPSKACQHGNIVGAGRNNGASRPDEKRKQEKLDPYRDGQKQKGNALDVASELFERLSGCEEMKRSQQGGADDQKTR